MELCRIFGTTQPSMSHHLKILAGAGLLQTRREGNTIFYRRALIASDGPISDLMARLFESIDRMALPLAVTDSCKQVHNARAQHSKEFFEKNADKLKDNQNLIAEFSHYSSCIIEFLSNEQFADNCQVIEVGPGESDLIEILAEHFKTVTAVDNSPEMLERTREKVASAGHTNVDYFLGELSNLPGSLHSDLIVLNMVLHHLPSPAEIFPAVIEHLAPNGVLLIADLCSHDQDWTRQTCGDVWLGFEPDDIDMWAVSAGLEKKQSVYLGLRNGFQIQVGLFRKPNPLKVA